MSIRIKNLEKPSTLAGGVLCLCEACTCVLFLVRISAALHIKPTGREWMHLQSQVKKHNEKKPCKSQILFHHHFYCPLNFFIILWLFLSIGHTLLSIHWEEAEIQAGILCNGFCYQCELTFYRSLDPQRQLSGNSQGFEACICGLSSCRIGNKFMQQQSRCRAWFLTWLRCSDAHRQAAVYFWFINIEHRVSDLVNWVQLR